MVSIIIPNYNHAAFLKQRIDTVLTQTYLDFEIILLDDCSTDHSRSIIEEYRCHPKVSKIVYNSANSGSVFLQWKKGIEQAKGDWIWIAESDDYCHPDFLRHLLEKTDKDKEVVLSYCQSNIIDENGVFLGKMQSWTHDVDDRRRLENYTNNGINEI